MRTYTQHTQRRVSLHRQGVFLREQGVTLMELLVVVAIIGIMVLIGLPNYTKIIMMSRIRTSSNDFLMKFRYVRSLAIKTRRELLMEFDLEAQTFVVRRVGHTEYNLLQDLAKAASDGTLGDDKYILYEEKGGTVCVETWNNARVSDEGCEEGYYVGGSLKKNGIDTDIVSTCSGNSGKVTFNPSGTFEETCEFTITNTWLNRSYKIKLFKGGQVRILG